MAAVLGIDLGSARWATTGTARLELADGRVSRIVPAAIAWPTSPLTPVAMADAIDAHARAHDVRAIAIDGPHAWRDPRRATREPGVGRLGEYAVRAMGKTGVRGVAYPRTMLGWTTFSIGVFDALLARADVTLAAPGMDVPTTGYVLAETFPTAIWRGAGLPPLPAKRARPVLAGYVSALVERFELPTFETANHDDLQAVVAALTAAALVTDPTRVRALGEATAVVDGHRVEGYVWDVVPR